jgi:hypothetical protein
MSLRQILNDLNTIEAVMNHLYAVVTGETLNIKFTQGDSKMAGKVQIKMVAKGSKGAKAVMPPQKWSSLSGGAELVVVDANGNPVPAIDPATVTTTLTIADASGNPTTLATATPGADSLNWKVSRTNATGNVVLNATLSYNVGSPGPFTSSVQIDLDTIPPGAPTDLQIVFVGQ